MVARCFSCRQREATMTFKHQRVSFLPPPPIFTGHIMGPCTISEYTCTLRKIGRDVAYCTRQPVFLANKDLLLPIGQKAFFGYKWPLVWLKIGQISSILANVLLSLHGDTRVSAVKRRTNEKKEPKIGFNQAKPTCLDDTSQVTASSLDDQPWRCRKTKKTPPKTRLQSLKPTFPPSSQPNAALLTVSVPLWPVLQYHREEKRP